MERGEEEGVERRGSGEGREGEGKGENVEGRGRERDLFTAYYTPQTYWQ